MRTSRKLSVALACPEGTWPHPDWPAPDDPYVERVVSLRPPPPFRIPGGVDVVVLRCAEPVDALRELRAGGVPLIVIAPHRDAETIVEVFRGGAGYLVEGDYCTCMLSSAVVGATIGHTYLSPAACAALREGARRASSTHDTALERLRGRLSPRERQIMELLSTGLGAQEIGLRLRLSEKTVRNNLSNIYAKLDARGSTDAVLRWLGAAPVLRI
ncbi:response regulator transcription factor [Streptomyces coeruleorubidus]|uniref:response regulator transcription factor n=1 Tax=Streptomyces coeruleorubidus TaxID=116188 RepID=UPI00237EF240|nr:response regulator transcription factor [Streptomyces coeruleorubidus]WDV52438.1 response regulator transcription factor [Streptomyces coeruleorubidus]